MSYLSALDAGVLETGGGGGLPGTQTLEQVLNLGASAGGISITSCPSISNSSGAVALSGETLTLTSQGLFDVVAPLGLSISGDVGTEGQLLSSNGVAPPTWIDASGVGDVLKAGNNAFTGINSFSVPIDTTGIVDTNGIGTTGDVTGLNASFTGQVVSGSGGFATVAVGQVEGSYVSTYGDFTTQGGSFITTTGDITSGNSGVGGEPYCNITPNGALLSSLTMYSPLNPVPLLFTPSAIEITAQYSSWWEKIDASVTLKQKIPRGMIFEIALGAEGYYCELPNMTYNGVQQVANGTSFIFSGSVGTRGGPFLIAAPDGTPIIYLTSTSGISGYTPAVGFSGGAVYAHIYLQNLTDSYQWVVNVLLGTLFLG